MALFAGVESGARPAAARRLAAGWAARADAAPGGRRSRQKVNARRRAQPLKNAGCGGPPYRTWLTNC